MRKVTINGVAYDVEDQILQAIEKERADAAEKNSAEKALLISQVNTLKTDGEKSAARLDTMTADLAKAKKDHADAIDPAKVQAIVNARALLVTTVQPILGKDVKLDTMTDFDIQKAVLGVLAPKLDLKDKSQVYIAARFDGAVESYVPGTAGANTALADARAAAEKLTTDGKTRVDSADPRARMMAHNDTLATGFIPGGMHIQ